MTDIEIIKACEMRLDGCSWAEIGEALHYTRNNCFMVVKNRVFGERGGRTKCTHPHVLRWMRRMGVTYAYLASEAGVHKRTVSINLQKEVIAPNIAQTIHELSGLSLEEIQHYEPKGAR